ncbi:hypothetical protein [Mesorhizobium sp. L-8-10]|nr:hypothetical protein [Mesorhizobium sp. L-8-10]
MFWAMPYFPDFFFDGDGDGELVAAWRRLNSATTDFILASI